jgi:hypothetical protein
MPQPRRANSGRAAVEQTQTRGVRVQRVPRSGGNTATAPSGAVLAQLGGPAGGLAISGAIAGVLTAAQIRAFTSSAAKGVRSVSITRALALRSYVEDAVLELRPGAALRELREIVRAEQDREQRFRRRQVARFRRDLPKALRERDERRRLERVQAILDRERRFSLQREEAAAARSAGAADALNVEEIDPEGAVWQLGPRPHHTPGCAFLHGRTLAWSALRAMQAAPPLGPGCGCRLRPRDEAWRMGVVPDFPAAPGHGESVRLIGRAYAMEAEDGHRHGVLLEAAWR